MCVPYNVLVKDCPTKQTDKQNKCETRPSSTEACPNGRSNVADGKCVCFDGFSPDPKTGQCVPSDCISGCVGGTCQTYGTCTCKDGSVTEPEQEYKCTARSADEDTGRSTSNPCQGETCSNSLCVEGQCTCYPGYEINPDKGFDCISIRCPDPDQSGYCQYQCQLSDCTARGGGRCQQGECRCNSGFKKETYSGFQCVAILCPSYAWEGNRYCQAQCAKSCTNGRCDIGGNCTCNSGFKKESRFSLYQCNEVNCPASVEEDTALCTTKCTPLCKNGTCGKSGVCNCNEGFKRPTESGYQCEKIICPSLVKEDYVYCQTQCKARCKDGTCDSQGSCTCEEGFTTDPDKDYTCVTISCPATVSKVGESRFCKSVCESQCLSGLCDDVGVCSCKDGFKKHRGASYNCSTILCPAGSAEDKEYCDLQCKTSCKNGECNALGLCECHKGFIPTNITMNLDCQHGCNEDGSCKNYCYFDRDCPLKEPPCSTSRFCINNDEFKIECTQQCVSQCDGYCQNKQCSTPKDCSCENGSKDLAICLKTCVSNRCALSSDLPSNIDDGDRNSVTSALAITFGVILLAIGIALWFWRRRKNRVRSIEMALTESVELRSTQDPRKRKLPVPGHFDTYLELRCIAEQPEEQQSQYENVEDVLPSVVAPASSVQPPYHSYQQMDDLTDVTAAVKLYSNVA